MNDTVTVYRTSFDQFVPFDYETYRKLKTIKSCYNVSWLKAQRMKKWGFKNAHNRTKNKPELCSQFHLEKESEHKWYQLIFSQGRYCANWESRDIITSQETGLGEKVIDAWDKSKPKIKESEVESIDFGFDLDILYEACLPYYKKHCMPQ